MSEINPNATDSDTQNLAVIKILQDALCAEYIYTERIDFYEKVIFIYNLLCFCIPIIVLASLYITKGNTVLEPIFNLASTIVSFILLIFMGIMFITSIPEKKESFIVSRRINRRTQKECKQNQTKSNNDLVYFFNHISDIDDNDLDKLGKISTSTKQASYRYALENLGYNAKCGTCYKLPTDYSWTIFRNKCKTCGIKRSKI